LSTAPEIHFFCAPTPFIFNLAYVWTSLLTETHGQHCIAWLEFRQLVVDITLMDMDEEW